MIFIYLKSPSIMLLADEMIDEKMEKWLGDTTGGIIVATISGQKAAIPVRADCNIVYVKEASPEDVEEFRKKREAEKLQRERRITSPTLVPPDIRGGH